MRARIRHVLVAVLLLLGVVPNFAQGITLGEQSSISLVTEAPGKDLYLAFGHTALRVRDPENDLDLLFNYGTIEARYLTDPSFVGRFLLGDLRYSLGVSRFQDALEYDKATQNRAWSEQVLGLALGQRRRLYEFLVWNARSENREYQYDFVKDNCANRIPNVLLQALGPSVRFSSERSDSERGPSVRSLVEPYLNNRFPLDLLASLGLGSVADRPLSLREETFLPSRLRDFVGNGQVLRDGTWKPLVLAEQQIYTPAPEVRPLSTVPPQALWWIVALMGIGVTVFQFLRPTTNSRPHWAETFDRLLFLLGGLAGTLILFFTIGSQHYAARENLNLLWLWPTHLAVAFLPWRGRGKSIIPSYFFFTAIVTAGVLILGFWSPQRAVPEVIPIIALLTARAAWLSRVGMYGVEASPDGLKEDQHL